MCLLTTVYIDVRHLMRRSPYGCTRSPYTSAGYGIEQSTDGRYKDVPTGVTCAVLLQYFVCKGNKCLRDAGTYYSLSLCFLTNFAIFRGIAGILSLPGVSPFSTLML